MSTDPSQKLSLIIGSIAMLLLPETITLTNGQEILSSEVKLEFENDIYRIEYLDAEFSFFETDGHFLTGSGVIRGINCQQTIFISDQTLDDIQRLNT